MPIDLDEMRKRHKRCSGLARCRMPCDAIQLADEVEYLRSRFTASQEEMTELLTEHRKQGKELERLRQERRDNFDEIRERF